jgi:Ca2+-binding EF-hand superfamily protein
VVFGVRFSHALTVKFPKVVDAFAVIDSDGSGSLSIKELAEGLTALGLGALLTAARLATQLEPLAT